jgi:uncharacterized spore protein YtfJ
MEHVAEMLESICEQLGAVARSEVVVGSAVELGSVTFVPISRVSLGFGAGGGEGEGETPHGGKTHGHGKGAGGGSGGGGKVRPVAVVVFSADDVQVLPIPDRQGKLDRLLDKIPDLVERFKKD